MKRSWDVWQRVAECKISYHVNLPEFQSVGSDGVKVMRIFFFFLHSKFELAGEYICAASSLTPTLWKIGRALWIVDPFLLRDNQCLSLSLSTVSFVIRSKFCGVRHRLRPYKPGPALESGEFVDLTRLVSA